MNGSNITELHSTFIKNILYNSFIPNIPLIDVGDYMIKGSLYYFGGNVLECVESGYFNIVSDSTLLCSNIVYCSPVLLCGTGNIPSKYMVIYDGDEPYFTSTMTTNFVSTESGYTPELHEALGKYLMWYRHSTGVNLLPLYNFFTKDSTTLVHLKRDGVQPGTLDGYTVWKLPISMNKNYSIFINSTRSIMVSRAFLNDLGTVIDANTGKYVDEVESSIGCVKVATGSVFSRPIVYSVNVFEEKLAQHSNNLYLLIQVPISHSGEIVVLEGDYSAIPKRVLTSSELISDDEYSKFEYPIRPSLSVIDTGRYRPFSDKLIEYLLKNPIASDGEIRKNFSRLKGALNVYGVGDMGKDVWNDSLQNIICNRYFTYTNNRFIHTYSELQNVIDSADINDEHIVSHTDDSKTVIDGITNVSTYLDDDRRVTDILGYADRDVENYIFKYRKV